MAVNGLIGVAKEGAPIPLRRIPALQILNEQDLETLKTESINVDLLLFNAGITEPMVVTRKKLTQWNKNVRNQTPVSRSRIARPKRCVQLSDL